MNRKLQIWWVAIPVVMLAVGLQLIYDLGERGSLNSEFLRENIYPTTRSINGALTNLKFKTRVSL